LHQRLGGFSSQLEKAGGLKKKKKEKVGSKNFRPKYWGGRPRKKKGMKTEPLEGKLGGGGIRDGKRYGQAGVRGVKNSLPREKKIIKKEFTPQKIKKQGKNQNTRREESTGNFIQEEKKIVWGPLA